MLGLTNFAATMRTTQWTAFRDIGSFLWTSVEIYLQPPSSVFTFYQYSHILEHISLHC